MDRDIEIDLIDTIHKKDKKINQLELEIKKIEEQQNSTKQIILSNIFSLAKDDKEILVFYTELKRQIAENKNMYKETWERCNGREYTSQEKKKEADKAYNKRRKK